MNYKDILGKLKKYFFKFWRSDDNKISLVRDVVVALLLVLIILTALWTYTGQWFGAPMVAIESGSMMHQEEPFGRFGTINAGDMVLLVKVDKKGEIATQIEKDSNNYYYGDYGDVIVYRPYGNENRDQIIHRAMCWIEYNEIEESFTVEGYDIYNESTITIPQLGLNNYRPNPPHSGYITKGDNPVTNDRADQSPGGICDQPIKVEWVSGKARGELPWIGTLNLLFNDITSGKNTLGNVPQDCIISLVILIIILISIPISLDIYGYYKDKKKTES
jgi:signal peptidase